MQGWRVPVPQGRSALESFMQTQVVSKREPLGRHGEQEPHRGSRSLAGLGRVLHHKREGVADVGGRRRRRGGGLDEARGSRQGAHYWRRLAGCVRKLFIGTFQRQPWSSRKRGASTISQKLEFPAPTSTTRRKGCAVRSTPAALDPAQRAASSAVRRLRKENRQNVMRSWV